MTQVTQSFLLVVIVGTTNPKIQTNWLLVTTRHKTVSLVIGNHPNKTLNIGHGNHPNIGHGNHPT